MGATGLLTASCTVQDTERHGRRSGRPFRARHTHVVVCPTELLQALMPSPERRGTIGGTHVRGLDEAQPGSATVQASVRHMLDRGRCEGEPPIRPVLDQCVDARDASARILGRCDLPPSAVRTEQTSCQPCSVHKHSARR